MKKATIEYDLSDGDSELRMAMAGSELASLVWDIDQELRKIVKYQSENVPEDVLERIAEIRASIGETISRYRLDEESYPALAGMKSHNQGFDEESFSVTELDKEP